MGKFGQDARVTTLYFFEAHCGIFNDHSESGSFRENEVAVDCKQSF